MGGPGFVERFLDPGGDAALNAEQDARQEGGLRIGVQAEDRFQPSLP